MRRLLLPLLLVLICGVAASTAQGAVKPAFKLVTKVNSPTYLTFAPTSKKVVYVAERRGRIRVIRGGKLLRRPFLDIRKRVESLWIEQGLLGIAFPPYYKKTGLYFVDYIDRKGDIRIDRFRSNPKKPLTTLPGSRRSVLKIPELDDGHHGHNGGEMRFLGKNLYISVGDGDDPGDEQNLAQNLESLRGKILRIDPRPDLTQGRTFRIPPGNPFVGQPGRDEIFAYGFRNPHSFAFYTPPGGDLQMVISDVGQQRYEEINYLPFTEALGANFGWKAYEGLSPYDCGEEQCPFGGPPSVAGPLTWPQLVYPHEEGCAVIGGPVIRDPAMKGYVGRLVFGDFCANNVQTAATGTNSLTDVRPLGIYLPPGIGKHSALNNIGEDAWGRIYLVSNLGGIYRLVPGSTVKPGK